MISCVLELMSYKAKNYRDHILYELFVFLLVCAILYFTDSREHLYHFVMEIRMWYYNQWTWSGPRTFYGHPFKPNYQNNKLNNLSRNAQKQNFKDN